VSYGILCPLFISIWPNTFISLFHAWHLKKKTNKITFYFSRFVYSQDIGDLLRLDRRPQILLAFDRMEKAGTDSNYDFEFPHYNADYYVAAYGFDLAGNRAKISNLVHVRVPRPISTKSDIKEEESTFLFR
jgi:hypothetical protein